MQAKAAIFLVGLLAMATAKPALPRGVIDDAAQALLKANAAVAKALADANQAIDDIHENLDQLNALSKAAAAQLIAAAVDAFNAALADLENDVTADAAKILECVIGQQDAAKTAGEAASDAILDSIATNINGIGGSLQAVIVDLQASNQALNGLENDLSACESADDANACAVDVLSQIVDIIVGIPTNIQGSVGEALAEIEAAGAAILSDTAAAINDLTNANLKLVNDAAACAVA